MSAVIEPNQVIYSADSHVLEPANLWPDYIDPKFATGARTSRPP